MNHSIPGLPVYHQLLEFTKLIPLSRWCHLTISSFVIPFPSCLQSFPTSGSFQMSQLFASGGQSTGISASTSVLPMSTQDWSPLGWTPCSPRDSQESSPTPQFKSINSSVLSFLYSPTLTSIYSVQFSSVAQSCPTLRPHESQHARPPCPSPTPGVHSDSRPSSHWCILPSHPLSSPSRPAPNPSQHQSLFQWVNSSHEVANVLEFQL